MRMDANKFLILAVGLLGLGLTLNAMQSFVGHHAGWPSEAAWGREQLTVNPTIEGDRGGIRAFPVQLGRGMYGFVLLDTRRHSLAVYRLDGAVSRLRLMAARDYRYDLRLKDFDNSSPTPVQVKKLLRAGGH
jgi:hypothetical protein